MTGHRPPPPLPDPGSPQSAPSKASSAAPVDRLRQAIRDATDSGDPDAAAHHADQLCLHLLMRGRSLHRDYEEVQRHLHSVQPNGSTIAATLLRIAERTLASLMGRTRQLADFSDPVFDGPQFENDIAAAGHTALTRGYWRSKVMLHFLSGNPAAALIAADRAFAATCERPGEVGQAECHFFTAMAICVSLRHVTTRDTAGLRTRLDTHAATVKEWAETTGSGIALCRHMLLGAEIASLDGNSVEAERLYEDSARTARQHGCLLIEALARELASRFHAGRGLERIAAAYIDEAIDHYSRWGADAKVGMLRRSRVSSTARLPGADTMQSRVPSPLPTPTADGGSHGAGARCDEGATEQLTMRLMRTLARHAGAEPAVLLLSCAAGLRPAAEIGVEGETTRVTIHADGAESADIPNTMIRFALRTGETIVIADAQADGRFRHDPYLTRNTVRSALCMPVKTHAGLQAVLYLENNLMTGVFRQARLDVLQMLTTLAAVSRENARLYADLQMREYKLRRLFEVDIIGVVFWDLNGRLLDANDAFLRMVGYSREDLDAGAMNWFEMTPPEWRDQVLREMDEIGRTGALRAVEKEYFRKDGSRLPVLMGVMAFDEAVQQGIAIVVDLSKQKEAEARALDVERRNRMLHGELAHTTRLITTGHLSAWIAHDVKQPLAGLVTSANAALHWIAASPPNIQAGLRAIDRVVRDGKRAADIVDRTHAHMHKAPAATQDVDVNEVVAETLSLIAAEARSKGIDIVLGLHAGPLFATADRTQLQQVVLNLLVNAMEAMDGNGVDEPRRLFVVSEAAPAGHAMIEVRDTGPGLPSANSQDCFEAFYTTKPRGLGVGLAICRSIIEDFGGRITASDNAPRGATFRFVIPRR